MPRARQVVARVRPRGLTVDELVRGFEHILEVERVAWRPPISSVLCGRVGRIAAHGLARVLAARAWVKAADRAPALRDTTDQIALFTSPDQAGVAEAIRCPRFYHATSEVVAEESTATQRQRAVERRATQRRVAGAQDIGGERRIATRRVAERSIAAERRLVAGCALVFADSPHVAGLLRDRHEIAADRVVMIESNLPVVERTRTMLAAMREVA